MNRLRHIERRIAPWLRGAVAVYLIGVVLVVAVHQHRDARRADDCALCTVAHTPAVVPHAASVPTLGPSFDAAPRICLDVAPDVDKHGAPPSRAPPRT
ncbi:MAG TPA: hypothetical protein VF363_06120 [Candidatus Eisenbacteria bacterium]